MKKFKTAVAAVAALATVITMSGCTAVGGNEPDERESEEIFAPGDTIEPELPVLPNEPAEEQPEEIPPAEEEPIIPETPKAKTVSYINVTSSGVNIRSGAGTNYSVKGVSEKSTMYAINGTSDGWYRTGYKNGTGYISSKYCKQVEMLASDDERIEAIIAEGCKLLGTAYVFGAVRYHDGNGNFLKNFTTSEFDCSSLMQYIFYIGAHVNLQVTTRTQIYQGKTVTKSQLKRGDLMFFTNETRKNNVGVERVGHVALYLGDNWILHTASDYAKIEQISALRWSYFIQGQRIF
ncbi:MAG: C40 family peptidase [Clostridia bacterium]|nr:C40 family peptidase [Clostridia bacterium]